jgi:hypothetical protein
MQTVSFALGSLALAFAACCAPAQAASSTSSAASAASDSIGLSSAGLSGSLQTSSHSSTARNVAQGEYRIVEIAAAPARPTHLRLTLQRVRTSEDPTPTAARTHDTLYLTLPQAAFETSGLGRDALVAATPRPYGVEFARAEDRHAFFLVLEDHWLQELAARPLAL